MKIVSIFEGRLYSFKYKGAKGKHELQRLLSLWSDAIYLYDFLKANAADLPPQKSIPQLAEAIQDNLYVIDDILLNNADVNFNKFFAPLHNQEYNLRILSLQKGREQYLRIYAIKIDENCFVITGGAIKLTRAMQGRKHTENELLKLNQCRDFLKSKGIFDTDSLHEWINE